MRLLRLCAEGSFIEAGADTSVVRTGESEYGKPILDLAVIPRTSLDKALMQQWIIHTRKVFHDPSPLQW